MMRAILIWPDPFHQLASHPRMKSLKLQMKPRHLSLLTSCSPTWCLSMPRKTPLDNLIMRRMQFLSEKESNTKRGTHRPTLTKLAKAITCHQASHGDQVGQVRGPPTGSEAPLQWIVYQSFCQADLLWKQDLFIQEVEWLNQTRRSSRWWSSMRPIFRTVIKWYLRSARWRSAPLTHLRLVTEPLAQTSSSTHSTLTN